MNLPEFLVDHPDGEIRLTGHRVGLFHVMDRYSEGYSPEMLREEYPTVPLGVIHQIIAFYRENQAAVDAYVAAYRIELARQEAGHTSGAAADRMRRQLVERQLAERGRAPSQVHPA